MNKVKVVFWSGTGNTQAMADAVANGLNGAGGEAEVTTFDAVSVADAAIIVVSGKAGVEVGTERAWDLCEKYGIPYEKHSIRER